MEEKKIIIDRAILVGLNADCFTPEETSDEKTLDELEALLIRAGFSRIKQYGERKLRAPKAGEGRIFFAARKES